MVNKKYFPIFPLYLTSPWFFKWFLMICFSIRNEDTIKDLSTSFLEEWCPRLLICSFTSPTIGRWCIFWLNSWFYSSPNIIVINSTQPLRVVDLKNALARWLLCWFLFLFSPTISQGKGPRLICVRSRGIQNLAAYCSNFHQQVLNSGTSQVHPFGWSALTTCAQSHGYIDDCNTN